LAISYHDITKSDFTIHRGTIDIVTGGFPCQPYSVAGKRKGKEDERHLWPEMLRAIREIQPAWVVGENVRGIINWSAGMVFDEVQAQLEVEGYKVLPFLLPAAGVNAPHERYRTWFVAYSGDKSREQDAKRGRQKPRQEREQIRCESKSDGKGWIASNSNEIRSRRRCFN
jgi:DNA (cytosine-5)-methyltransferase 1